MKDEFRAISLEWIKKAQSDYGFTTASFREFDDFYSQMCILKAFGVNSFTYMLGVHKRIEQTQNFVNYIDKIFAPHPQPVRHLQY